ncbi:MAG: zf-TFIIB domain-containing protein [Myxococcota bacterium]
MADEEDYFRKLDQEAKAKLKAKLDADTAEADKAARRSLHLLKCGKCGGQMKTQVFRGLEIEVCEDCSAVLLDPGELQTLAGADQTATFSSFFSMFGSKPKS